MARFVQIQGYSRFINVDKVRGFYKRGDTSVIVEYSDEAKEVVSFSECFNPEYAMNMFIEDLRGTKHIKQIIPVNQPMYAVYNDSGDNESQWVDPVYYLALTEDGELKGAISFDGYFEVVEAGGDCEGLYYQNELAQFNIAGGPDEAADQ